MRRTHYSQMGAPVDPPEPRYVKNCFRERENRLRSFIGEDLWDSLLACIYSGDDFDTVPELEGRLLDFFCDEDPNSAGGLPSEWIFNMIMLRFDHFIPEKPEGA